MVVAGSNGPPSGRQMSTWGGLDTKEEEGKSGGSDTGLMGEKARRGG